MKLPQMFESANSRAWRACDVLACLAPTACLRDHVIGVLSCLRVCVFSVLACFMSLDALHACYAQISYVLSCLRASLTSRPIFFIFEKLNSYIKKV